MLVWFTFMIYVHELKIKLLKCKLKCCPVFSCSMQILSTMEQWRVPVKLAKRVAELVFPLVIHTPKSLEFPQRLFSPICVWNGKTYRQRVLGARAIIRNCRLSHKRCEIPEKSLSFPRSFSNKTSKIRKARFLNDFCNINVSLIIFTVYLRYRVMKTINIRNS